MENTETINYWVHGDASSSNVDISPQKTITHLKKAILAEEPRISLTTASLLDVYLGNIRDTAEAMGAFSFNNLNLLRGSQRINANFLEGFPDDTIHFVIKRPDLSQSEFLRYPLPLVPFTTGSAAAPASSRPRTPLSVELWKGFKNKAIKDKWDTAAAYSPPVFIGSPDPVRSELSVQMLLQWNLFHNLNQVLNERFCPHSEYPDRTVVGEPDFVATNSGGELLLVIEAKTISSLAADNLVQAFLDDDRARATGRSTGVVPVFNQICQIYGYLSNNRLRYGAITNYSKTWFLFRPDKSTLRISPPVSCDATQPTLFQCFATIATLALENPELDAKPPSPPQPPPSQPSQSPPKSDKKDPPFIPKQKRGADEPVDKETTKRRTRRTTGGGRAGMSRSNNLSSEEEEKKYSLQSVERDSFQVLNVLGTGRTGRVLGGILNNKSVALKILDLWQHPELENELINEVKVYRALKQLQGNTIPRFEKAGYVPGGLLLIATEIVGAPLEDVARLSKEECLAIERVLASIHSYGYIHGDVRKENILVKRSGDHFNPFFIDFAFARRGSQAEFYEEKRVLTQLLGSDF